MRGKTKTNKYWVVVDCRGRQVLEAGVTPLVFKTIADARYWCVNMGEDEASRIIRCTLTYKVPL